MKDIKASRMMMTKKMRNKNKALLLKQLNNEFGVKSGIKTSGKPKLLTEDLESCMIDVKGGW